MRASQRVVCPHDVIGVPCRRQVRGGHARPRVQHRGRRFEQIQLGVSGLAQPRLSGAMLRVLRPLSNHHFTLCFPPGVRPPCGIPILGAAPLKCPSSRSIFKLRSSRLVLACSLSPVLGPHFDFGVCVCRFPLSARGHLWRRPRLQARRCVRLLIHGRSHACLPFWFAFAVFLMYTGNHYDVIVWTPTSGAQRSTQPALPFFAWPHDLCI